MAAASAVWASLVGGVVLSVATAFLMMCWASSALLRRRAMAMSVVTGSSVGCQQS